MTDRALADRSISVVVPTLNEGETIGTCLDRLASAGFRDVTVVDGGSRDGTVERAESRGVVVMRADGGLFAQLDRGARTARGEWILFHYADGELPVDAARDLAEAGRDPEVVGGAFRLAFASDRLAFRVVAWGANLRNRLGLGPFGDQSIFVRADVFEELGGFAKGDALADFDLVRRLRRRGPFVILRSSVRTSVRRWEKDGFFRTLGSHWWVSACYLARGRRARGRVGDAVEELRRKR